jgi:hypothetical protein
MSNMTVQTVSHHLHDRINMQMLKSTSEFARFFNTKSEEIAPLQQKCTGEERIWAVPYLIFGWLGGALHHQPDQLKHTKEKVW